ncbi:hypothetical protein MCA1582 [Methylococcus capsulatus str. Bath]|uniref:Uncharacterized protein n=1 Tax=Methylococcus capsulatus (strain ATCC 33009 / NCIMB 11132 / Bath) TaxID=243233 RepID=Q608B5_METCA|nr:hypothetical protein MCA1582 [Methylococcus capsulatus str. Bath]
MRQDRRRPKATHPDPDRSRLASRRHLYLACPSLDPTEGYGSHRLMESSAAAAAVPLSREMNIAAMAGIIDLSRHPP